MNFRDCSSGDTEWPEHEQESRPDYQQERAGGLTHPACADYADYAVGLGLGRESVPPFIVVESDAGGKNSYGREAAQRNAEPEITIFSFAYGAAEIEPDSAAVGEEAHDGAGESDADVAGDGAITKSVDKSLKETIQAAGEWLLETGLVFAAHCVCPPAGHLAAIVFEAKEAIDDAVALASPDTPRELHVPLVHLPPGFELAADVQLGDEVDEDEPRLSLLMAPGDGGLFGGWALERDKHQEAAENQTQETEQDEPAGAAVIDADLSSVAAAAETPRRRAAILRGTAYRLHSEVWDWPEYSDTSLIVIYDGRAHLGMWLARPDKPGRGWRMVLDEDAVTGRLFVRLVA
jgi:hypothetical protein